MSSLVDDDMVDRVLFLILHNGGGKIIPGKPKYISIIEEAKSNKHQHYLDKHQKKSVDIEYMQKLIKPVFSASKMAKIKTEELSRGLIKDLYEQNDIKESIIIYVAFNEDYIWYINLISNDEIDENNEALNKKIQNARNTIANVLENYYKLEGR